MTGAGEDGEAVPGRARVVGWRRARLLCPPRAGKMHDDLRKSMKDDSLKHSLFAAFNTK